MVVGIEMSPPLSPPLKPIHFQECETREHCVLSVFSSFPASRDHSFQNKTVSQTNFDQKYSERSFILLDYAVDWLFLWVAISHLLVLLGKQKTFVELFGRS